jgi:hypothetical protein
MQEQGPYIAGAPARAWAGALLRPVKATNSATGSVLAMLR